ncbi:MAG: hypothetical protein HC870_03215 [Rhizobiales bacterium]|nr:hypothetical protein [Hyphomicrobiales bacterium]
MNVSQPRAQHRCSQRRRNERANQAARPDEAREVGQLVHVRDGVRRLPGQRRHYHDLNQIGDGEQQGDVIRLLRDDVRTQARGKGCEEKRHLVAQPGAQQKSHRAGIGQPDRADRLVSAHDHQAEAGQRKVAEPTDNASQHAGPIKRCCCNANAKAVALLPGKRSSRGSRRISSGRAAPAGWCVQVQGPGISTDKRAHVIIVIGYRATFPDTADMAQSTRDRGTPSQNAPALL